MQMPPYFETLIIEHGLTEIRDALRASAKPSIHLLPRPGRPCNLGGCRFGGVPDEPFDSPWPLTRDGRCLAFLAQLDLAELASSSFPTGLPEDGRLLFFYDVDEQPWGFFEDKGGWRVYHAPPAMERATRHSREPSVDECALELIEEITFPAPRSIESDALSLSHELWASYFKFRDAMHERLSEQVEISRVLGHPDAIQGCMQRTIQFESRNEKLPQGVYSYYEHPRAEELIPGAFDWRLLLQIDSIKLLNLMWGDAGRIFFWIHRDDLEGRRFDQSWLKLQCY
jgi:uncharacterized protein YwqG